MATLNPLFIDITWSAGGQKTADKQNKTLEITKETQDLCCLTVNMHLTCNTATRQDIMETLNFCKSVGISNILALRGDPPLNREINENEQEFKHAIDLVKLIREEFGDFFSVSVAGYPYGHPDCGIDKVKDVVHLKEKVDAGADFVVSQMFFDASAFITWMQECRNIGITVPLIPGILPIQGYKSLQNITKMCAVPIPESLLQEIEHIKDDDAAIREWGIKFAVNMCKQLIEAGAPGLHFYTLNQEVVTSRVLAELKLVDLSARELPWRRAVYNHRKQKEEIRPIYWANRFKSYLSRTSTWDEFPNGRWGDSNSPAYGELTDYHIFFHQKQLNSTTMKKKWGQQLNDDSDVSNVFVEFLNGRIDCLPWIDFSIAPETNLILRELIEVNEMGFWTINSQPRANAVASNDPAIGWGGSGGWVYQKAYLEFFTSPENLALFLSVVENNPRYNYQALNMKGDKKTNLESPMAVTWGVFPGKQILQPTVVDPVSFQYWKEEAFVLWSSKWGRIYDKDSVSRNVIQNIEDNYFLVNVVDNDFVNGNIFDIFERVKKLKLEKLTEKVEKIEIVENVN